MAENASSRHFWGIYLIERGRTVGGSNFHRQIIQNFPISLMARQARETLDRLEECCHKRGAPDDFRGSK